jgi:hypothetical protein
MRETGNNGVDMKVLSPRPHLEIERVFAQDPGLPVSRYDTKITVFGSIRPQETGQKSSPLWDRTSDFVPICTHCVYDLATDGGCPHWVSNVGKNEIAP